MQPSHWSILEYLSESIPVYGWRLLSVASFPMNVSGQYFPCRQDYLFPWSFFLSSSTPSFLSGSPEKPRPHVYTLGLHLQPFFFMCPIILCPSYCLDLAFSFHLSDLCWWDLCPLVCVCVCTDVCVLISIGWRLTTNFWDLDTYRMYSCTSMIWSASILKDSFCSNHKLHLWQILIFPFMNVRYRKRGVTLSLCPLVIECLW